jgi:hypothetical protein
MSFRFQLNDKQRPQIRSAKFGQISSQFVLYCRGVASAVAKPMADTCNARELQEKRSRF